MTKTLFTWRAWDDHTPNKLSFWWLEMLFPTSLTQILPWGREKTWLFLENGVRTSYGNPGKSALCKPVSQLGCELKSQRKPLSSQSSIISNSFWWKAWVKEVGRMKGWRWREMVEKAVSRYCVTMGIWGGWCCQGGNWGSEGCVIKWVCSSAKLKDMLWLDVTVHMQTQSISPLS